MKYILKDFCTIEIGTHFRLSNLLRLIKTVPFTTDLGKKCNAIVLEDGVVVRGDEQAHYNAGQGYVCEPWEVCEVKVLNV